MKLNWGIIGCGDVTEVKSGPAFNLIENSSLKAVMRRDIEKAKDYARRHHVPKFYGNADELINDPEVNAIYVATPPSTHAEYAIRAMEAGKPVYVEKPMAMNDRECREMIAVANRMKVPLFVAYYRRALPGFLKVRELIDAGEIGDVQKVKLDLYKAPSADERNGKLGWRVDPAIAGGGHFFDLASHQLDLMDFLFGPGKYVDSAAQNLAGLYPAEDYVEADLLYQDRITFHGLWDFSGRAEGDRDSIEIIGERGSISFSTFDFIPVILTNEKGSSNYDFPKPAHVQYPFIKQLVSEFQGSPLPAGNGESAARTSKMLEEIVKDYYRRLS